MTFTVPTQPEPEHIARAGNLLEAILAADLQIETRLCIGAALDVLWDVFPPYPPRLPTTASVDLQTGLALVMDELQAAIEDAVSIQEAIRAGMAGRELHPLLGLP